MRKPFINTIRFGVSPKLGKLFDYHCLTNHGKSFLIEEMGYDVDTIKSPIGLSTVFRNDYWHRTYTLDFHIALRQWTDLKSPEVLFFDTYFDKVGNNRKNANLRAKTRLHIDQKKQQYLIPDAIFMLEIPHIGSELYCLEIHNGKDTGKFVRQLENHLKVLVNGSINEKHSHFWGHRILCLFEHASIMEAVIQRTGTSQLFKHTKHHFLFRKMMPVFNDLYSGWKTLAGEWVNLY
jgi:hypothetical protein